MTLLDLIQSTPSTDIIAECERIDPDNGAEAYQKVLAKLATVKPTPTGFTILIEPWESGSIHHNISGLELGSDEHYAVEFTPWDEWLGAEIRIANLDLTPAQIIAQCLFEMTFVSFDQQEVQDKKDQLIEMVEEIKRKHDDDEQS